MNNYEIKEVFKKFLKKVMWAIPFASFIAGYFFSHILFHERGVIVPVVVGKHAHEAIEILTNNGLHIQFYRNKDRNDVAEGVVLEQSPRPGSMIKLNQNVLVTLARHIENKKAPNLIGKKYGHIISILKQERIGLDIYWLKNSYPKNYCFAQMERAIYFSLGTKKIFVFPDFRGKELSEVKEYLDRNDIKVEVFKRKKSGLVVIDQKPMPGSIIDRSKQIYVQLQV